MGRHGVPYASRGEFGHTHLQLAGGEHLVDDHLVDVALVAHLERTHVSHYSVLLGNLLAGIGGMGGGGVEVELGGVLAVLGGEHHVTVAASDIESLLEAERIGLVAHLHDAFTLSHVEDTHLTSGCEEVGLQGVDGFEFEFLVDRHGTSHHHTVIHGVHHVHLVGSKHLLDQEVAAYAGCVITLGILGVGCVADFIICLHLRLL